MKALALLLAALLSGCMYTPAELRERAPDARAMLAGPPEVAAKCVGTRLPELRRFGDEAYHVTADLLGVRAQCGNFLCAVIDLKAAGNATEAVAYTHAWPAPGITGAVRDAFEACAAR